MPPIHKILIANRGEIACRIIRTCRKMGIDSVAVFSDADLEALHVRMADEAVQIGGSAPGESYLNMEKIIRAAKQTSADAIHPGYGFLAENADFSRQVNDAGLVFIGPQPDAIEWMGSKIRSKEKLATSGVPVLPGYHGADQSVDALLTAAKKIGFPLLLKASAGGGGKGMRIVHEEAGMEAAIAAAKREAQSAFGDPALLIEKYFPSVRHVEFQIFGDTRGNLIHLYERECSIQRRYQKIIEESPSVALDDALRQKMGAAAVAVAQAVNYVNAGTVEFLLTPEGDFYFLEMNTRLQVEHPVTEMITGLDLVEWQIRIASGEPLPLSQQQITSRGHAIECRLYAEDPASAFRPDTGTLLQWELPATESLRVDSGVRSGDAITSFYDPMIAKLITHGSSRESAIRAMRSSLQRLVALGLKTNRAFLCRILDSPFFLEGDFHTASLESAPDLVQNRKDIPLDAYALAAFLYDWRIREENRKAFRQLPSGWRNNYGQPQQAVYVSGDTEIVIQYKYLGEMQFHVVMGSEVYSLRCLPSEKDKQVFLLNGHRQSYALAVSGRRMFLFRAGLPEVELERVERFPEPAALRLAGDYLAPLPGEVGKLFVTEGQEVSAGDPLLTIISMKMENTLFAREDGVIKAVLVKEKEIVEAAALLISFAGTDEEKGN